MSTNSIKIKSYLDVFNEYAANAAITPGMLVELMSTNKVRAHATDGGNVLPMFAIEDALQGKDIDDAYVAGDQVRCWIPQRGDEVYAILADDESASIGSFLVSHGDGTLRVFTSNDVSWPSADDQSEGSIDVLQIVAIALEAMDTTASSEVESTGTLGSTRRIRVRIV
jgi:hypothetical protein